LKFFSIAASAEFSTSPSSQVKEERIRNDKIRRLFYEIPCVTNMIAARQLGFLGKVVRGPAPLSLALAHATVSDDVVQFSTWTETDFRTNEAPWWS